MNHAIGAIEFIGDNIEILRITRVEAPEHRIRNVICELHNSRGAGIHKKWRISQIANHTPLRSQNAKIERKLL